jgi:hypothetical protein
VFESERSAPPSSSDEEAVNDTGVTLGAKLIGLGARCERCEDVKPECVEWLWCEEEEGGA